MIFLLLSIIILVELTATVMSYDPAGFNPEADTVGPGIYGGCVKRDAAGNIIIGDQYERHNPNPGPIYTGEGYTEMSKAIHTGRTEAVIALLATDPSLVNEISTGGATPLHICGMSMAGQLVTQVLIDAGGELNSIDTYGYTPLHRMASNDLDIGAEAVLRAGADVNFRSVKPYQGDTALKIALGSMALKAAKVIRKYGGVRM